MSAVLCSAHLAGKSRPLISAMFAVHTLLVEVLVGFGGSCQELAEGSGNGQVLDVR